jgi:hypothetical protein
LFQRFINQFSYHSINVEQFVIRFDSTSESNSNFNIPTLNLTKLKFLTLYTLKENEIVKEFLINKNKFERNYNFFTVFSGSPFPQFM